MAVIACLPIDNRNAIITLTCGMTVWGKRDRQWYGHATAIVQTPAAWHLSCCMALPRDCWRLGGMLCWRVWVQITAAWQPL